MTAKALCVGLIAASLMAACGGATTVQSDAVAGKLKVVATYSILGDLVQNVGGDKIEMRTLVGPGADTHEFEPTPADAVALAEAALIFENGLGFETWLNDLYAASDSQATRIVVTKDIEPLAAAGDEHEEGEAEHESAEFDPHVWHDAAHVIHMVEVIRDALVGADPAQAGPYTANANAYLAQLRELDAWVFDQVAT
ncbi:MAG: metal ABC transporter solute-binding protein, Zn/Mn family, partial [Burkholderiales bacterium]